MSSSQPAFPQPLVLSFAPEIRQGLETKAALAGQTIEEYLVKLVENDTRTGIGHPEDAKTACAVEEEEPGERPWRGVFTPERPRNVIFSQELDLFAAPLPRRRATLNLNWHREVADNE